MKERTKDFELDYVRRTIRRLEEERGVFGIESWKSFNLGIEIGLFFIEIYVLFWSVRVGVRFYGE